MATEIRPPELVLEGFSEASRAFKLADKTLLVEFRKSLRRAAEPVRSTAEQLAVSNIPKIGIPWSRMRVGVTTQMVYVAPKQRGRNTTAQSRRPNLAPLLMGRSMLPALKGNEFEVVQEVDHMLGHLGEVWAGSTGA